MRILVAGDTHHNRGWCATLSKLARRHGCEVVVQLGDFGYWPRWKNKHGKKTGESFLDGIDEQAARHGVEWVFIDGNHDDHASLRELTAGADGFVRVRPHLEYAPRGQRWKWAGVTFGALGGAYTLDAVVEGGAHYTPGVDWFPELEQVSDEDVDRLGSEPLDVLLTHDVPAGVPLKGWRVDYEKELRANQTREGLRRAVENATPKMVMHGHWHVRHHTDLAVESSGRDGNSPTIVAVEGFASDVQGDVRAWGVLDLDDLTFAEVRDGSAPSRRVAPKP